MRPTRLQITALLLAGSLLIPEWAEQPVFGNAAKFQTVGFTSGAVSPALVAAGFHPDGYDRKTRVQQIHRADDLLGADDSADGSVAWVRVPWSVRVQAFPRRRTGSPTAGDRVVHPEYPNPQRVQQVIETTSSRSEALKRLREEVGWSRSVRSFDQYTNRYGLKAPWRSAVPWHIDRSRVQSIVETAQTLTEAVERVRQELGRPMTSSTLSRYIKRHGLTTPWHIDSSSVQEIVVMAHNLTDAADRIRKELGRSMSTNTLRSYIKRHGLTAPWIRKSQKGFTLLAAVLPVWITGVLLLLATDAITRIGRAEMLSRSGPHYFAVAA